MAPSFSKPVRKQSAPDAVQRRSGRKTKQPDYFLTQKVDADGFLTSVLDDIRGRNQPESILDNRDEEEKKLKEYRDKELKTLRPLLLEKAGFRIKAKKLNDVDHILVGPHYRSVCNGMTKEAKEEAKKSQIHGVTWYKVGPEVWEQYLKDGETIDQFIARDNNWRLYDQDGNLKGASATNIDTSYDSDATVKGTIYDSDTTVSIDSPGNKSIKKLKSGDDEGTNGLSTSSRNSKSSTTNKVGMTVVTTTSAGQSNALVISTTSGNGINKHIRFGENEHDGANLITPRSDDSINDSFREQADAMIPTGGIKTTDGGEVTGGIVAVGTSAARATTSKAAAVANTNHNMLVTQKAVAPSNACSNLMNNVRKNGLLPRLEDVETEVFGEAGEGKIPDRLKALEDLAELPPLFLFHERIERLERLFIP